MSPLQQSMKVLVLASAPGLVRALRLAGFDAEGAEGLHAAIALLERHRPRLIVSSSEPGEAAELLLAAQSLGLSPGHLCLANIPPEASSPDPLQICLELSTPAHRIVEAAQKLLERVTGHAATECQLRDALDGQGWVELTAPSRQEHLDRFQDFCELLVDHQLSAQARNELKIAVQELGQNAIEWGNRLEESREIKMAYRLEADRIQIRIGDEGPGFDRAEVPDPSLDPVGLMSDRKGLGKRPGGFGIHLARQIMDRIEYNERGNVVLLEKRFSPRRIPTPLAPLALAAIGLSKTWGDSSLLAAAGLAWPDQDDIGELWLASDLPGQESPVIGDPQGRHLGQIMAEHGADVLGPDAPPGAPFPLLIKIICAREMLSVQVHPDSAAAKLRGLGPRGKHESWLILAANDESRILRGLTAPLDADGLRSQARSGDLPQSLVEHRPRSGEVYDIPPGTIHACGSNLVLLEVQERCDITFRLFDWTDRGRELHLEAACEVSRLDAAPLKPPTGRAPEDAPYAMKIIELEEGDELSCGERPSAELTVVLVGSVTTGLSPKTLSLGPLQTLLWPASSPPGSLRAEAKTRLLRTFQRIH